MIEATASLWTAAILIWPRHGSVGATLIEAIILWEVFIMLCSYPTDFLVRWPLLQPGSWLMVTLACASIVGGIAFRLRRAHQRPRSPKV